MITIQKIKIADFLHIFLIFFLVQLWGCQPKIANLDSNGKDIICFGDSITKGAGSTEGNDYPSLLSQKLNMQVINAGVDGDTTRDALARINEDVLQYNPRLVIVEFSGNDFLKGISPQETFDNLDRILVMIQQKQAMVVMAEVAAGHFGDKYLYGFKKIAKKRRALLIPNIMKGIFFDPSLKSDQIHPNDAGYHIIADRIYKEIKSLLE
ncbi:MAG: GDSL-type esterase/lipase family protein [Candidatus Omnitrophota bacterium]